MNRHSRIMNSHTSKTDEFYVLEKVEDSNNLNGVGNAKVSLVEKFKLKAAHIQRNVKTKRGIEGDLKNLNTLSQGSGFVLFCNEFELGDYRNLLIKQISDENVSYFKIMGYNKDLKLKHKNTHFEILLNELNNDELNAWN